MITPPIIPILPWRPRDSEGWIWGRTVRLSSRRPQVFPSFCSSHIPYPWPSERPVNSLPELKPEMEEGVASESRGLPAGRQPRSCRAAGFTAPTPRPS